MIAGFTFGLGLMAAIGCVFILGAIIWIVGSLVGWLARIAGSILAPVRLHIRKSTAVARQLETGKRREKGLVRS
jgi:hypothetical protein